MNEATYHGAVETARARLSAAIATASECLTDAVAGLAEEGTNVPTDPLRRLSAATAAAIQHASVLAGLFQAAQSVASPAPAGGEHQCQETDHDNRGDCDEDLVLVKMMTYRLGAIPGEEVYLCGSHACQAARKGEIQLLMVITNGRRAATCSALRSSAD